MQFQSQIYKLDTCFWTLPFLILSRG